MKRGNKIVDSIFYPCAPLAFIGNSLLTTLTTLILHPKDDMVRKVIVWTGLLCVFLVVIFKLFYLWLENKKLRKKIYLSLIIPLLAITLFVLGYCIMGQAFIISNLVQFIFYFVPAYYSVIIIYYENKPELLKPWIGLYSIISLPVIITYIIKMYQNGVDYKVLSFGVSNYMNMGYFFQSIVTSLLVYRLISKNSIPKLVNCINILLIALYTTGVFLTGTRGSCICVVIAVLTYFVISFIIIGKKEIKTYLKNSLQIIISICVFLSIPLYVFKPVYSGLNRVQDINYQLESNSQQQNISDNVEVLSTDELKQYIRYIQEMWPDNEYIWLDIYRIDKDMIAERGNQLLYSQEEIENINAVREKIKANSSQSRLLLWKLAISDIKDSIVIGNGPFYFWATYDAYPHNIILEVGCDYGMLGIIILISIGVITFLLLVKRLKKNIFISCILIATIAKLPMMCLSGSLYSYIPFVFLGGCAYIALFGDNFKSLEKVSDEK